MIDLNVSDRIERIAGLITKPGTVADIGTDHGYLPIYLVREKSFERVIACDLRKKPLERAKENARALGLEKAIDFRLSDGLEGLLAGEAETIVICGMGGFAIQKILAKAIEAGTLMPGTDCVLSPHTDRESLSRYLYKNGFKIEKEILLHERAAYYILWKCTYDGRERDGSAADHAYGARLLNEQTEELKCYLLREEELLMRVLKKLETLPPEKAKKRMEEIEKRLELNKSVRWF